MQVGALLLRTGWHSRQPNAIRTGLEQRQQQQFPLLQLQQFTVRLLWLIAVLQVAALHWGMAGLVTHTAVVGFSGQLRLPGGPRIGSSPQRAALGVVPSGRQLVGTAHMADSVSGCQCPRSVALNPLWLCS
jgi:hypothetical protein